MTSEPQGRTVMVEQTHFAPIQVVVASCRSWTLNYLYERRLPSSETSRAHGTQYLFRRYQAMPFDLGHQLNFGPWSSDDLFADAANRLEQDGVGSVEVKGDLRFAYLCRRRKEYLDHAIRDPNAGPVVVVPRP